jgi:hypothetical protein
MGTKLSKTPSFCAVERRESVVCRKDHVLCWVHANPEGTREELYDVLCGMWPEVSRAAHRGMVNRLDPENRIQHACTVCNKVEVGVKAITKAFGLRRNRTGKRYFISQCTTCRGNHAKRKRERATKDGIGVRQNPAVFESFTNTVGVQG